MTEGLKSEALFFEIYFFEKIPPACLTATHLPLQGRLFLQKDGRRVRVSLPFLHYTEKRYRGKSRYLSWRRRRDTTGFQPVVFALRTVYFMSLFAPQKDGRRVRVSPNKFIYTKRKSTKEKSLCLFWRRRRDSTGFQPVVFALRTVYFMSLFAPQKDGRRVRVSPNKFIYTKRKSTKEKSLCFFWRRRRDSNSRAGYPTYALSRGASSPT